MQSRGGQKIQGARKIHTEQKKDLQQAEGRTIFNSYFCLLSLYKLKHKQICEWRGNGIYTMR